MTISTHSQTFPRAAGVVIPLFSLRGARDVGTGEILDLLDAVEWLASWRHAGGHRRGVPG